MSESIQERLEKRRKTKGRSSFDDDVESSPIIYADIPNDSHVRERIIRREKAAFLPMDDKVKVFQSLTLNLQNEENSENRVCDEPLVEEKANSSITLPVGLQESNQSVTTSPLPSPNSLTTGEQQGNNERTTSEQLVNVSDDNLLSSHAFLHKGSLLGGLQENNGRTSGEQHDNNKRTIKEYRATTSEQPANNTVTSGEQPVNELVNKQVNNRVNKQVNTIVSFSSKSTTPDDFNIHRIKGHKRKILAIVYRNTRPDDFISDPIDTEVFTTALETDQGSVKTVIRRLERMDKYFEIIDSYSSPSGGWRIFKMQESVYRALDRADAAGFLDEAKLQSTVKQVNNRVNKQVNNRVNKQVNNLSSSSSVLNTSKTTTEEKLEPNKDSLPEEWKEIDYSCLVPLRFTENHLLQIYQSGKVTPDVAQESIYELHHDLTVNQNKTLRNPRNVLLSLLKKGIPYTAPGYESEALKAERRCLEEQKKRNAELLRIREETESIKNLPQKLSMDIRFQSWLAELTLEQRRELAPQAKVDGSEMQRGLLRSYWESTLSNPLQSKE